MKAEHSQRKASRELAEDFTSLIAELEDDKSAVMLAACSPGLAYISVHLSAFSVCVQTE